MHFFLGWIASIILFVLAAMFSLDQDIMRYLCGGHDIH
jgi:hypothetical protein